jgi:segregation and condensation protein A
VRFCVRAHKPRFSRYEAATLMRKPEREESPEPNLAGEGLGSDGYRIKLPVFEGPLDLLLHLVRKHELDILNIPIAFITEQYTAYLRLLDTLNVDVASEYLLLAATLIHIKTRSLLPNTAQEDEADDTTAQDEGDPRAELVRRLLEYQKYKNAAEQLSARPVLGRDVFGRGVEDQLAAGAAPLAKVSVFQLLDAFQGVLEQRRGGDEHEIDLDRYSVSERMTGLEEILQRTTSLRFTELFDEDTTRAEIIITFLALLEMTKLGLTLLSQAGPNEPIIVELAARRVSVADSSPEAPALAVDHE